MWPIWSATFRRTLPSSHLDSILFCMNTGKIVRIKDFKTNLLNDKSLRTCDIYQAVHGTGVLEEEKEKIIVENI